MPSGGQEKPSTCRPVTLKAVPLPEIKFGTDGWRGVMADDFTYASVRRVAQGIAEYMRSRSKDPVAVVGYDCRFASEEFARNVADVFGANGVRSLIFDRPSPTQVASWTVIDRKATGAAVITASHNPWLFNGVKYKPETGSSADSTVIGELEKRINALGEIERPDREKVAEFVTVYDPRAAYYEQIGRMVDLPRLRDSGLRVVHECMHGSGYGYVAELLGGGKTTVTQLHSDRNPFFGGLNPEPIPPNIDEAIAVMKGGGHDLCILTDGDADRVGIIDETGRFINHLQHGPCDRGSKRITEQLANHQPKEIAGVKVARVRSDDGFKFYLEDGSWVLFRTSGTEALVRIYSEAPDAAAVQARLKAIEEIVGLKQEAAAHA